MLAVPRLSENQTVTAGPWTIVPTYKTNKLQSCTMSRSDGELGATFVRTQDGLSVILEFRSGSFTAARLILFVSQQARDPWMPTPVRKRKV